jgi:hypothetical protein
MSLAFRALLLVLSISVCAHAQTRTLALYGQPPLGLDSQADRTMGAELQRLLAPAGLEIIWKTLAQRESGGNFELVVVNSFEGSCTSSSAAAVQATANLADTSISNGRILPFFRIDCGRIVQILGSDVEPAVLGRALGRVMAHEIYHIVAQTKDHQETGVAKAAFSRRDLTTTRFRLDDWSITRMRPATSMSATPRSNAAAVQSHKAPPVASSVKGRVFAALFR